MTGTGRPPKRALITGITGQDGSYLAEFLLGKGYEVHGLVRRASTLNTSRLDALASTLDDRNSNLFLHSGDLGDAGGLSRIVHETEPEEVYHLAAQSNVRVSFEQPEYTVDTIVLGTLRLLEAVRSYQKASGKTAKYYQASSSEMYGKVVETPQRETTPFYPRSAYAAAKVYAYWQTRNYREGYDLFAVNGILFNHESPRRGETFVTRKITRAATRIKLGLQHRMALGNLDPQRDWGYAKDYVEAMWIMLQQDSPDDYVIATGVAHTVRDFLEAVFSRLDMDWREYVDIDSDFFRSTEVDLLVGDASKARRELQWEPQTSFDQLIDIMIEHDLELAHREKVLMDAGHATGAAASRH